MILRDDGLLEDLHDGMHQQPLWGKFLENLRVQTRARFANLTFRTIDQDVVIRRFAAGRESPEHLHRLFIEKYSKDPLAYRHMREGRVYSLEDLIDPADPWHRSLVEELLAPQGLSSIRSVRVSEPSGIEAWLSCVGGKEVGAAAGAVLNALTPHFRLAMRSFVALEREKNRSAITSDALGRLSFGWLTLDAHCRVVDMTPHAERFLKSAKFMKLGHQGRLMLNTPALDRELSSQVKKFAETRDARPRAFTLSQDPYADMLIAPAPVEMVASSFPVAVAYISGDHRPVTERHDQLAQLFGLLPSQAKLAWAIARGASIAEAAEELGVSLETARTYSKKIYAKIGARGQPDLVRIVLTSILAVM